MINQYDNSVPLEIRAEFVQRETIATITCGVQNPIYLMHEPNICADEAIFGFTKQGAIRHRNTSAESNLSALYNRDDGSLQAAVLLQNPWAPSGSRGVLGAIFFVRLESGCYALGPTHALSKVRKATWESLRWSLARWIQQQDPDAAIIALKSRGHADDTDMLEAADFRAIEGAHDGIEGEDLACLAQTFGLRSLISDLPTSAHATRSLLLIRAPGQWCFMRSRTLGSPVRAQNRAISFQTGKLKAELSGKFLEFFSVNVSGEAELARE